jgi:hypothetical protein
MMIMIIICEYTEVSDIVDVLKCMSPWVRWPRTSQRITSTQHRAQGQLLVPKARGCLLA